MKNNKRPPSQLITLASEVRDDIYGYKGGAENFQEAISKYKTSPQYDNFPKNVEKVSVDSVWIDHSVQRDIKAKHIKRMMDRFDPRLCMPAAAVTHPDHPDRYMVYDGQHRIMTCHLLGITEVPVCVVSETNQAFPAYAFEICNDSGIAKASKEDIHRTLLHRWNVGDEHDREDAKVRLAHRVQEVFDSCGIDLEGQMTRKSAKKRGDNQHFFSHFQYAYLGYEELKRAPGRLAGILNAIKTVYPDQEEIDQGLYIGLVEAVKRGLKDPVDWAHIVDKDQWMIDMLKVIRYATGPDAKNFTQESRKQWDHVTNGLPVEGSKTMLQIMYEVFKRFYKDAGCENIIIHDHDINVGIKQPWMDEEKKKYSISDSFKSMLESARI
tara:strand:- start:652 stop:1794 length:1143 start_codon:yes stop_codon:yes gene_type:complete